MSIQRPEAVEKNEKQKQTNNNNKTKQKTKKTGRNKTNKKETTQRNHRIAGYPKLEGMYKVHQVQLLGKRNIYDILMSLFMVWVFCGFYLVLNDHKKHLYTGKQSWEVAEE